MSKIEVPEIPPEMAHQALLSVFKEFVAILMRVLTDKFGSEEALKLVKPYIVAFGKQSTEVGFPMLGIEGKDAIAIATLMKLGEEKFYKVEEKVTEANPDKVVVNMTDCIFKECKPEVCELFTFLSEGTIQAINPEYEIKFTKMMTKGDKDCEYIIEKKK